jgi:hypothetical protein
MLKLTSQLVAAIMVLTGLYLVAFGNAWGPTIFEVLSDSEIGLWLELIVPFLPMVLIACGAALYAIANQPKGNQ